jgi:hypothetical protein
VHHRTIQINPQTDACAVGRGRSGRPDHDQTAPSSDGKAEAATAVVELLMMGMRMPETC